MLPSPDGAWNLKFLQMILIAKANRSDLVFIQFIQGLKIQSEMVNVWWMLNFILFWFLSTTILTMLLEFLILNTSKLRTARDWLKQLRTVSHRWRLAVTLPKQLLNNLSIITGAVMLFTISYYSLLYLDANFTYHFSWTFGGIILDYEGNNRVSIRNHSKILTAKIWLNWLSFVVNTCWEIRECVTVIKKYSNVLIDTRFYLKLNI